MASKLLTDQQLDLLTDNLMAKVKEKQDRVALQNAVHPKLNLSTLRKHAEAYLKERQRLIAVVAPVSAYMDNSYSQPDNVDLADFDKWHADVNRAYSKHKAGVHSRNQMDALRKTIKGEILRASISAADLDKALTAIEKKYM